MPLNYPQGACCKKRSSRTETVIDRSDYALACNWEKKKKNTSAAVWLLSSCFNTELFIPTIETVGVDNLNIFCFPAASDGPRRMQLVALLRAQRYYHYYDQTKAGRNAVKHRNADVEICPVAGRRYSARKRHIYIKQREKKKTPYQAP